MIERNCCKLMRLLVIGSKSVAIWSAYKLTTLFVTGPEFVA